VAAGVGLATVLTFVASVPGRASPNQDAGEPFNNGTGNAIAMTYKVNPIVGNLSFGLTVGLSLAAHQNTGAQAQSEAVDTGVIGMTLAGEGCMGADPTWPEEDQPQPVVVGSNDEGAERGVQEDEAGLITKFARANPTPFAEAVTTSAPMGDSGVAQLAGGQSIASSGVVDGNTREARAFTRIGSATLAGGAIELRGLEWEATHRSGAVEEAVGRFEVGALVIGGQEIPLPSDAAQQAAAIDEALRPLGLTFTAPQVRVAEGIVFVDPMKIGVIPAERRDSIIGPILGELQPVREAIFAELLAMDCGELAQMTGQNIPTKSLVSIFDIALASVSGAGSMLLELGGVQATTGELNAFQFPELPSLVDPPPVGTGVAPSLPAMRGPTDLAGPVTSPQAPSGLETGTRGDATRIDDAAGFQPIADLTGSRGGALALVGGLGLAALLAAAEADRRKMRRALREIPLEA
jgi:hypothetical protein